MPSVIIVMDGNESTTAFSQGHIAGRLHTAVLMQVTNRASPLQRRLIGCHYPINGFGCSAVVDDPETPALIPLGQDVADRALEKCRAVARAHHDENAPMFTVRHVDGVACGARCAADCATRHGCCRAVVSQRGFQPLDGRLQGVFGDRAAEGIEQAPEGACRIVHQGLMKHRDVPTRRAGRQQVALVACPEAVGLLERHGLPSFEGSRDFSRMTGAVNHPPIERQILENAFPEGKQSTDSGVLHDPGVMNGQFTLEDGGDALCSLDRFRPQEPLRRQGCSAVAAVPGAIEASEEPLVKCHDLGMLPITVRVVGYRIVQQRPTEMETAGSEHLRKRRGAAAVHATDNDHTLVD